MQRLPSDGSARLPIEDYSGPTYFTAGYSPRPSPDGTLVAFDAYLGVVVAAANEPSSESWLGEAEHDGGAVVAALAWSADSARLVWIESLFHEGDVASLFVAEVSRDGEIGPPTPLEPVWWRRVDAGGVPP